MRFHIVALPHTQVTKEYAGCAFTEKVRRFVMMMKAQGHTVYLYAGEQSEGIEDELITCISEEMRAEAQGSNHYTSVSFDTSLPHWQTFNGNAIREIAERFEEQDFICLIGGGANNLISSNYTSIVGGTNNKIGKDSPGSAILGGNTNTVSSLSAYSVILSGQNNDTCGVASVYILGDSCLLYTSPSPRDRQKSRMPSSA